MGLLVLALCMLVNCWHTHLWGPDEPREAEIAREILNSGSWAVPYFNGIPFVEKPPLYCDVSAWLLSFGRHPGGLRLHSAFLGCLMLGALCCFAAKKCGKMTALAACAICVSMPQFYRAAHWILLDIGVGAWVTAGLVCYGLWSLRSEENSPSTLPAVLFFLFAALAALTKGVITLVYLGIIILPHWFFFKRRRPLPPFWTLFFFLIPVGIWLFFFYREGGIYCLHEHFVNNIFGRLLHREFRLPGSPITISDVGHNSPLFFYLKRLPSMFGAVTAVLPLAAAWAWRMLGWPFFSRRLPEKFLAVWDVLTKPRSEVLPQQKELLCYLMLWSFVPFFIFSIPAIKEVTYLLPSYAGSALLLACYFSNRLAREKIGEKTWFRDFLLPLFLLALIVQLIPRFSLTAALCLCAVVFAWLIAEFIRCLCRRKYSAAAVPVLAALIGGVLLGNIPELMEKTRRHRKCYCDFAEYIWQEVGRRSLYLEAREESIRGALPFYGNRDIRILSSHREVWEQLSRNEEQAVLLYEVMYRQYCKERWWCSCCFR